MKTKLLELGKNTQVKVSEDTQFVLWLGDFSPDKKYAVNLLFEKEGATAELLALYKLNKGEHLDLTTVVTHKIPNTTCRTSVKCVLLDDSSSKYVGKIIIDRKARQTNSYLEDHVLMVGENTRSTSEPILEIEADDVQASHGATSGKVDPEQIYYLQTRGLSEKEAEKLIVRGFFAYLLNEVKDEKIKNQVYERLNV